MTPTKPRPVTKALLGILAELGGTLVDLNDLFVDIGQGYGSAHRRGGHEYVLELKALHQAARAQAAFRNLRRARYITARKIGRRFEVSLTPKGSAAVLVQQLRQLQPKRGATAYTVVVFDVPQTENRTRDQLRWLLRQGGFTKLQQSVWVGPAEAYQLVAAFVRQVHLQRWVNLFQATNFFHLPR